MTRFFGFHCTDKKRVEGKIRRMGSFCRDLLSALLPSGICLRVGGAQCFSPPMAPMIKVHAYKVNRLSGKTPLEELLESISKDKVGIRNREVGDTLMRLEVFKKGAKHYFCDFLKIRTDHGPGKAGLETPVTGFDLTKDEGFGEETAMFYDSETQFALLQYNHHGPRQTAIQDYLSSYIHDGITGYQFAPKYVDDLQTRLGKKKIVRRFDVSVVPRLLTQADYDNGVGLGEAIALSNAYGAETIQLSLAVARGRKNSLSSTVMKCAEWIMKRSAETEDSHNPFKSCEISARDEQGLPIEVLDLVAQRMCVQQSVLSGIDKRFTQESRWDALSKAWRKMHKSLVPNESGN